MPASTGPRPTPRPLAAPIHVSGIDIDLIEREWEEEPPSPRRSERRHLSPERQREIEQHDPGRVVGLDKGWLSVLYDGEVMEARYAGSMRGERAVVGDRVRVRPPRREREVARVLEILERRTVLTRTPDDDVDEERVVVANADRVLVMLAADHLETGAGFLDRVMVAAGSGGLETAACVNRIDLVGRGDPEVAEVVDRYSSIGVPVVVTSATERTGLEDLREFLADRWTVLTGHSGVGKSTLCNVLVPGADREVGELGRYGGRHTTVSTRALAVPGTGGWLVDTPGVRSFGLGVVTPRELAAQFPELRGLDCAMDDCRHDGEPGCRVEEADIHPARLASYHRLLAAIT